MKTMIRISFELKGDFNPQEITQKIGLEPSETWKKGDKGKYKGIRQYDFWCLDTGYINSVSIDEISKGIYNLLKLHREKIAKLISDCGITSVFQIVAKIDGDNTPSIFFSEDIVKLASEFNSYFDIDLYVNHDQ